MRRVEIAALMLIAGLVQGGRGIAQAPGPASEQTPRPASSQSGNAEQGKKLYVSYGCYQCHGYEAQGSSATGPRLGPRAIAFASFAKYTREPTGQMPPYTIKVASDADIADIYAFVLARPAAPPVENIPLLK
jgi:ubiquinol-cytochrome c reductase cytochrome c subunit